MADEVIVQFTYTPKLVEIDGEVWRVDSEVVDGRASIWAKREGSHTKLEFWEGTEDLLWPTHLYGFTVTVGSPQFNFAERLHQARLAIIRGTDTIPGEFT
jgi:hypothetical protein